MTKNSQYQVPWSKSNVGVCYEYSYKQIIHDQWLLNIRAFNVQGYERKSFEDEINRDNIISIASISDLPKNHQLVVVSPQNGRYVQASTSLHDFSHPSNAIYYFGTDEGHMTKKELNNTTYEAIYLPISEHLWSSQAASIILYDRLTKLWP
jgi:tRNA(Leu) C34 or U34 (ribose-2'-O)-methylase TrmL